MAHMRARGHDVRILASDYRRPGLAPAAEFDAGVHRELQTYWRDHAFPRFTLRQRLALERHNGAALEKHLAEFAPAAVNWWAMGGMSLSLVERVRRRGLPAVGVVGDEWLNWGPRADGWVRFFARAQPARLVERRLGVPTRVDLARAAVWLFNSETVKRKALTAQPGLRSAMVVHPGVDSQLFKPASTRPWRWRLLYLGRLDRRKGVDIAVRALSHLPAARLTVQGTGDDAYRDELRNLAARLAVDDRVIFCSAPRSSLPEVYEDSDAVLFPVQWDEPWGLVPLEAMTVGRPVIATGTGGSSEYLRHEENCLIYRPRDSATALAAAIRRLAADERLRERLIAAGAKTGEPLTADAYNDAILATTKQAVEKTTTCTGGQRSD